MLLQMERRDENAIFTNIASPGAISIPPCGYSRPYCYNPELNVSNRWDSGNYTSTLCSASLCDYQSPPIFTFAHPMRCSKCDIDVPSKQRLLHKHIRTGSTSDIAVKFDDRYPRIAVVEPT